MIKNRVGFSTLVRREIRRFTVVFSQTLLPPLVSSALFLFVFGLSLGEKMNLQIRGTEYIHFLIPGLVMMYLIESPYTNASSSLFISRWQNLIQELLLSPLSYFEMVLGLLTGAIARGLMVGIGVYAVSLFFASFPIRHPWIVAYFFLVVPFIFACVGLMVGLWAEGFENLSFWSTFILTPLIYFGGVFHSVEMIPETLRFVAKLNPIFYLVSGLRYGMLGVADVDIKLSMGLAAVLAVTLFITVERMFRAGYKLRA